MLKCLDPAFLVGGGNCIEASEQTNITVAVIYDLRKLFHGDFIVSISTSFIEYSMISIL